MNTVTFRDTPPCLSIREAHLDVARNFRGYLGTGFSAFGGTQFVNAGAPILPMKMLSDYPSGIITNASFWDIVSRAKRFTWGAGDVILQKFNDCIVGEFFISAKDGCRNSSFSRRIPHVVSVSSVTQVIRIHARGIVARMKYHLALRDRTFIVPIREAVGKYFCPVFQAPDQSVSSVYLASRPLPATCIPVDGKFIEEASMRRPSLSSHTAVMGKAILSVKGV